MQPVLMKNDVRQYVDYSVAITTSTETEWMIKTSKKKNMMAHCFIFDSNQVELIEKIATALSLPPATTTIMTTTRGYNAIHRTN